MDVDPKHDQALDLPLSFPGDSDVPRSSSPSLTTAKLQQHQRAQTLLDSQRSSPRQTQQTDAQLAGRQPRKAPTLPTYTVYIRVPAPRNGFVDPPDSNWSQEKDDALWRILSRAQNNNIDWEELAAQFETTVSHILIQSTILTEQHVSQVRAQTRKVAALGARDSPTQSPARLGEQSPSLDTVPTRYTNSPGAIGQALSSEAMGRTLSGGSRVIGGRRSAETMRRTASAGSKAGGSRRLSVEEGQVRPAAPIRPNLETLPSQIRVDSISPSNTGAGQTAGQTRRLQSPLPINPARKSSGRGRRPVARHETEDERRNHDGRAEDEDADPDSVAASSTSSSSSSSDESEPVMSRIFRRPPGYPQQQQQHQHLQEQQYSHRVSRLSQEQYSSSVNLGGAPEAAYGGVGLGISSGGSDDGDESETQAAFLSFKSAAQAMAGNSTGSSSRQLPNSSTNSNTDTNASNTNTTQRQLRRRPAALQEGQLSSPSSSASVSPTTKVFKGPTMAAGTGNNAKAGVGNPSPASAAAAARLQQSRVPGVKSPPHVLPPGRSVALARAGAATLSREDSETGTTPSIGSSFSDLDDVSFTQSVLDEALGSNVEDTMVQHSSTDTLSSSANQRVG